MPLADPAAYLTRLQTSAPTVDPGGLRALHLAHALAIPFENFDIQLRAGIRLDLPALEDKLVRRRRGGYCFEQNTLFAAALETFGFPAPTAHQARVRMGRPGVGPRTHRVNTLALDGKRWLVDVGFGGDGLLYPVELAPGLEQAQESWSYRIEREGSLWTLWSRQPGDEGWIDLYAFPDEASFPVDDEVANHYTSTHPASRFVTTLTAQRVARHERHVLRGRTYERLTRAGRERRVLVAPAELQALLREVFDLEAPVGLTFPPA